VWVSSVVAKKNLRDLHRQRFTEKYNNIRITIAVSPNGVPFGRPWTLAMNTQEPNAYGLSQVHRPEDAGVGGVESAAAGVPLTDDTGKAFDLDRMRRSWDAECWDDVLAEIRRPFAHPEFRLREVPDDIYPQVLGLLYAAQMRRLSGVSRDHLSLDTFFALVLKKAAQLPARLPDDGWSAAFPGGLNVLAAFDATHLLRQHQRGDIDDAEYYRGLGLVLGAESVVLNDLGRHLGSRAIELVRRELGDAFAPLLTEPGLSTRVDEFVRFAKTIVAGSGARRTPGEVRDLFAEALGQVTLYRSLSLTPEKMAHMRREGVTSRYLDVIVDPAVSALELLGIRQTVASPADLVRSMSRFPPDHPAMLFYAYGSEYWAKGARLDLICRSRIRPRLAMSQSVTGIRQIAQDVAMHRHWGTGQRTTSTKRPYLFVIRMPKISCLQWNTESFPTHVSDDPVGDCYADYLLKTSDGVVINFNDERNEVFVVGRIRPEWIQSIEELGECPGTFTLIKKEAATANSPRPVDAKT